MTLEFNVEFQSPFFLYGNERLPSGTKYRFSVETDGRLKQEVKDFVVDLLEKHCMCVAYEIKNWDSLPEV
jgi:hypothetical protein